MITSLVAAAEESFEIYGSLPPERIALFLEKIAEEILELGDSLLDFAGAETALPRERLTGERMRTVNQLRLFAVVVRKGTWKDVRIDPAIPDRQPLRRPDLRRTLVPIGPVAVWAASNFPLAFSVAGGDTASALAAGCPVIVKAHPGHPQTSEMVASAIRKAIAELGLPTGVFGMVQGSSPDVSLRLVRHPGVKAGAFTGSLKAGRALFDEAAKRAEPIPFFAEMGSVNPVFVLSGASAERGDAIVEGLFQSVNMGVGQFCTCPGVVVGMDVGMALDRFAEQLRIRFSQASAGTMLTSAITKSYCNAVDRIAGLSGVRTTRGAGSAPQPVLFEVGAATFLTHPELRHEVFGPSTILVRCSTQAEMESVARALEGSLTATVHGTDGDLRAQPKLLTLLARKVGRLVFNGFPTGVEVCDAMQHGGPYPATTDPRFTSVGTAAIVRFGRPICFQDCPPEFLPAELR
jgi:alpha-ketoglutaric semialdehyde dehydrogenase